ncbi:hypothetical protein Q4F19_15975 [Sphingomonas sp. BIUV-7]|uniref:Uncharacterized protein n=1 Tax=Sphingomonas natans TaxID=3063330 RepID=A0ABT8YE14_9SPHN|nr:hypothetical protein [Sphingomonas sp. BIUV-7]MDO6415889.1 hypothetical protein [Sphingomonas sp. BIUV-7]
MIKFALPLLAVAIAAPAVAQTQVAPLAFERDGIRYEANVMTADNGVTRITGKELDSGRTFDLKLINGKVVGRYDRTDVRYDAPSARIN